MLAYVLLGLVCLVWGSTWLVIKIGLRELPALTAAGLRIIIAGLTMAAVAPWLAAREGGVRPAWSVVLAQALSQFTFNYAIVYYAEGILPSGLVSVLWSVFPLLIALGGHFVTRSERLSGYQWLGCAIGCLGVAVLFITDIAGVGGDALGVALLLLLAPASVAASTLLIKQRAHGASSVLLNRDSMLVGGGLLLLLALVFERDAEQHWTASAIACVAYLAFAGTVFTFGVYLWLLRHLPAFFLSLTSYVVPVIALLLGVLLGDEPFTLTTLAGALLVLAGVALTLRRRRPDAIVEATP